MDFLGIGLPELITILVLALIFIGPRDLPKVAGRAAKFLRDLRMMSEGFTTEWRREIGAATRLDGLEELKAEWESTQKSIQSISDDIKNVGKTITSDIDKATKPQAQTSKATTPKEIAASIENSIAPPQLAQPEETSQQTQLEANENQQPKQVNGAGANSEAVKRTPPISEEVEDTSSSD